MVTIQLSAFLLYFKKAPHPYHTFIEDPGQYSEIDRFQDLDHPISYTFKATSDPDTQYLHKTLKAEDSDKFKEAMIKEIRVHTNKQYWIPFKKDNISPGTTVLPAVWSMKQKRKIDSREVYKWKS